MALGLSTWKALSILKEQLEAVLEGHLKERKKCLTWKVKLLPREARARVGWADRRGRPKRGPEAVLMLCGVTPVKLPYKNQKEAGLSGE